jgi:glycosyltransferase involved in cell wall biosynthesis
MVCSEGLDVNVPTASSTLRVGFCRGFANIGVRYEMVGTADLGRALTEMSDPIVFLTTYDYLEFDNQSLRELRKHPHFVWVNPWFKGMKKLYRSKNLFLEDSYPGSDVTRKVLRSDAAFVWTISPESCLDLFDVWRDRGQRVESIPLACDTERYYPTKKDDRFNSVDMAFVGGYRAYKNIQYDKYLKPYEDRLDVFAVEPWPYVGYKGQIADDDERVLYQNARVCPALSEPHAEFTGDIVERAFKVMGSGGLAITDVLPAYRDLFTESELLVPQDVEEYHHFVTQALDDGSFNQRYRQAGYEAVMNRHTYAHRAARILELLERDR